MIDRGKSPIMQHALICFIAIGSVVILAIAGMVSSMDHQRAAEAAIAKLTIRVPMEGAP